MTPMIRDVFPAVPDGALSCGRRFVYRVFNHRDREAQSDRAEEARRDGCHGRWRGPGATAR
jgi:hypothetical protein